MALSEALIAELKHEAPSTRRLLERIPEDDKTRAEKEIQKLTDQHVKQVDQVIAAKEAEIMEV